MKEIIPNLWKTIRIRKMINKQQYSKEYYQKNKLVWKERYFKRKQAKKLFINYKKLYGITKDEYLEMSASQNHVCKLCLKPCQSGKRLAVDHCHTTGRIRGLLCSKCNQAIGLFKDNYNTVLRAAEYLK